MTDPAQSRLQMHGSCVAIDGRAALITGASGTGKSALSLDLVSRGAVLVADDQVVLEREGASVFAMPLPGFEGQIEARGIGILKLDHLGRAPLSVVVDLEREAPERLPARHMITLLGVKIDLVHGRGSPYLGAAVAALLRGTRIH